ncbi:MAG: hypothetical protein ACREWG_09460 [Gammaproteobacteria bacterium]
MSSRQRDIGESSRHPVLGETRTLIGLSGSADNRELAIRMAAQCRRGIDIVSRHLDPAVYDEQAFVTAVKAMVLTHTRSRVRILVLNTALLVQRGHRLLELAIQLSSFIELRTPAPEHREFNAAILVADQLGFIYRPLSDRYAGNASFCARKTARGLTQRFDELWQYAVPDPNLRRLQV